MELVFVAHRSGTSLQIADIAAVIAYDERALKLSCVAGVDAEISGEFHRATHAFGNVDERTIGENSTVEGGKEVVAIGHNRAEIFADEFGIFTNGLRDTAKDDAFL